MKFCRNCGAEITGNNQYRSLCDNCNKARSIQSHKDAAAEYNQPKENPTTTDDPNKTKEIIKIIFWIIGGLVMLWLFILYVNSGGWWSGTTDCGSGSTMTSDGHCCPDGYPYYIGNHECSSQPPSSGSSSGTQAVLSVLAWDCNSYRSVSYSGYSQSDCVYYYNIAQNDGCKNIRAWCWPK